VRQIGPLLREVLARGGVTRDAIDAVAYTAGPGLAGALLVGAGFAVGLATALGVPALPVHHLEGHLLSPLLADPAPDFPFVALLVSGGHTQLMHVRGLGDHTLLGESVDDAAGEAFDKTAKLLGLPYPGGPALAGLADQGDASRFGGLPRPKLASGDLDFSFSGLKTAVLTATRQPGFGPHDHADLAAGFQAAVVDVLVAKAVAAARAVGVRRLVVAGGVGANRALRAALARAAAAADLEVFWPDLRWCTDNGAMVALVGALRLAAAWPSTGDGAFGVRPRWPLDASATPGVAAARELPPVAR
jgi:N6-L-threonylcarbamoyladenine synthase